MGKLEVYADNEKNMKMGIGVVNSVGKRVPFDYSNLLKKLYVGEVAPKDLRASQKVPSNMTSLGTFNSNQEIWLYPLVAHIEETFIHELGHAIAFVVYGKDCQPRRGSKYWFASKECKHPSEYGNVDLAEDFAETFSYLILGRKLPNQRREVMVSIVRKLIEKYPG